MKSLVLTFFLVMIALAPVLVLSYYSKRTPKKDLIAFEDSSKKLEANSKFEVKACKVLDGSHYEMFLEGGKWIRGCLSYKTKDKASQFVVDLLNKTNSPPSVTLLHQKDDFWFVDFYLSVDGKMVNLVDLLRSKGLLLQN